MRTKVVKLTQVAYDALSELQKYFSEQNSGLKVEKSDAVILARKHVAMKEMIKFKVGDCVKTKKEMAISKVVCIDKFSNHDAIKEAIGVVFKNGLIKYLNQNDIELIEGTGE